jgi:hypothetical protein
MCSKEVSSILLFLTKAKKFKKKLFPKTPFSLNNSNKRTHCLKNSPKNQAQPNFKVTLLHLNPLLAKAPSSLSPKQLPVPLQTMLQVILYRPIHASKKLLIDCAPLWSI